MQDDLRTQIVALLPRLRRFAHSLTGTRDAADDILQSALERALSRLHQFTPGSRLDSWMFRIVYTTAIDAGRAQSHRRTFDIDDAMEIASDEPAIDRQVEARLSLVAVQRALELLPTEQRALVTLVALDGFSYQDAATALDIPLGTVMSRLSRARRKLADALETPATGSLQKPKVHAP